MRILVVEDEARIRAFLARAFEAEGFTVDVVEDGEQGLELALTGSYEFVILDLLLPGRDGLDVLAGAASPAARLPVLILSARSDLATKLRGFELGAVDYLAKPFSLDELLARARVQLRRSRSADDGSVLRVGRSRARPRPPSGPRRRHGGRPLRPRVPPAAFPDAARRRGDQPRSVCCPRSGDLTSTRARTSSTSACGGCAGSSGRTRRSRPSATPATAPPRESRRAAPALPGGAAVAGVRRHELRGDGRVAELGDDPVPLRLDQPHARCTASACGRCAGR